jgi:hypothetical protein
MPAVDETMSQHVEANSSPAAVERNTERDLQRSALRDLVELSTQCAARETQIEEALRSAVESANRELRRSAEQIEQRIAAEREKIEREFAERSAGVAAEFGGEFNAINMSARASRQRIESDSDAIERDAREKLQHATWLAESVLEAAQNQLQAEYKKAKEEAAAHTESLDALDKQAAELLETYGHRAQPSIDDAPPAAPPADPKAAYLAEKDQVEKDLWRLRGLTIPRLFVGVLPYLLVIVLCVGALVYAQGRWGRVPRSLAELNTLQVMWRQIGWCVGGTLAASLLLGWGLWAWGRVQVRRAHGAFAASMGRARRAVEAYLVQARASRESRLSRATRKRDAEVAAANERFSPMLQKNANNRKNLLRSSEEEHKRRQSRAQDKRDGLLREANALQQSKLNELRQVHEAEQAAARARTDALIQQAQLRHDADRADLERQWHDGLARIQQPIGETNGRLLHDWNDAYWQDWKPSTKFSSTVRFGELRVDLPMITQNVPRQLKLPDSFSVPAILAFPRQSSLLIEYDRDGRDSAIRAMQMVMARLLVSLPPGRVRFTIIDPVGLGQNFAGFMHLADHDEALVGGRIWTESEQIDQRLANLTEHMETVIQKYLRNEFETIDDYNAQAGELAEPYRFLVIADFPHGFQGDAFRRLASIASTGSRCGVYTLVARDLRVPIAPGTNIDELERHSVTLSRKGDRFVWNDEVFRQFPLTVDPPPAEQSLTQILDVVGRHAKDANRVEVPFTSIAPPQPKFWTGSAKDELRVSIGRLGATRLQTLRLGKGVAQHALIAGKTGSGKSTLLHVLVTNLAMWYPPDEVEFYLVDFKKGVEFKTYATHVLPHARAIAVESDREFGLSVLQRVDAELTRRGELYRKLGVQDLAAYRQATRGDANYPILPRTLLIIDEFQEFFSEDDKLAQDAGLLLDRLVRQGRAFGIHLLLGSQTIGGTSGLARSTIGQMAVRIALQTSEADSQLILGDNNSAARLLSRPGEAIYNDAGGLVEANSPFQVAWLPDEEREGYLKRVRDMSVERKLDAADPPVVFEGNAPADIRKNRRLEQFISALQPPATSAPLAWVGEPVAIKDPTAVPLRRVSGANLLIIGQQEEGSLALMLSSLISLAAQHSRAGAQFVVFDGTPADSPMAGMFDRVRAAMPHESRSVDYRAVPESIAEIHAEMLRRQGSGDLQPPGIYLLIYGLQRYRVLRHQEESFSFSSSDDAVKPPQTDRQFADLLREGPAVGIHIITWCDTPAAVERTLDRASMREFDHRILFQMSASDSSNLIDSPAAGKLGFYRALAYSEEQGTLEKFRPYALPDKRWLDEITANLKSRR